jgi:hypothetical protein
MVGDRSSVVVYYIIVRNEHAALAAVDYHRASKQAPCHGYVFTGACASKTGTFGNRTGTRVVSVPFVLSRS